MRRKNSDPNGRGRIPESDRHEVALVVEDDGEVARFAIVGDTPDGLVEDPRMSTTWGSAEGAIRTARLRRLARGDSVGTLRGYDGSAALGVLRTPIALFPSNSVRITLHNDDFRPFLLGRQELDRVP